MRRIDASARLSTRSRTVADLLPRAAELFGAQVAIRHKRSASWQDITFADLAQRAGEISRGLIELGVAPGERVCVLSETRPDWTLTAFAIAMAGAVVVPIYPSSTPEECAWVMGDSGAVAVVCGGAGDMAKVEAGASRLPALRDIVSIEPVADVLTVAQLRERGRGVPDATLTRRTAAVAPDDDFLFAYTSGTTGPPKGCVHTHGSYRAGLDTIRARDTLRADDLVYLFLPLSHAFALMVQLAAGDTGAAVAYYGGNPQRIVAELAEVRPTFLPAVPRIFEKIFRFVAGGLARDVLDEAIAVGVQAHDLRHVGREVPTTLRDAYERLDATLFAKVRAVFGGRLREAGSGAAPIAPEILEFFYASGVPVMEGWGLTETAVGVTASSPAHHRFGTVGRAVPGVELRTADDGEVLVKGDNVFAGYHGDPDATAAALVDGWLHTGDLGSLDAEGYLTITGRKKDIIITAGGKNLTPANIENDMRQSRWVSHAVMHGDRRPYPVMLVTLDEDEILGWAEHAGLPNDVSLLARHPDVRGLIQADLDTVNSKYAQVARIKKFTVLDHDLSRETGELTPTLKVKRSVVNEKYADLFGALYLDG